MNQRILLSFAILGVIACLLSSGEAIADKNDAGAKVESKAKEGPEQEDPPLEEKPTHDALIALRDRILKKHDAKDIAGVLVELDEQAVVTMQDGKVCRGPKEVQAYYEEKVGRPDSIVKELKTTCVIDRWSRLYNDQTTAIVDGRLEQDYFLRDGKQFHLVSPWTASLVKRGDDWKIAGFHVSANMFDNGVLDLFLQQNRLWTGVIAGVVGLVVGLMIGMAFSRRGRKVAVQSGSR
jgi:hypothetical protein